VRRLDLSSDVRSQDRVCSQRGVAHMRITRNLLPKPGTTLMRPACSARMPADHGGRLHHQELQNWRDFLLSRGRETSI